MRVLNALEDGLHSRRQGYAVKRSCQPVPMALVFYECRCSSQSAAFPRGLRLRWPGEPGRAERIAESGAWNTLWWLDGILLYAREAEHSGRSAWSWSRQRKLAEEHTTVHVYDHSPLEATRVILSPASRACTPFVQLQAFDLAICFAFRGAGARGGEEEKELRRVVEV